MKKLDEIPKKNIYEVPEGYFDKLPSVIQARVSRQQKAGHPFLYYAVRFALPVLVLAAALLFWIGHNRPAAPQSAEEMLAEIHTESLIAYLAETELTTEQLLDAVDLTQQDIYDIENKVYDLSIGDDEDLDALLDEYNYELLN